MNSMHPIMERVPEDFPPFIGKAEYDSAKFLKWNNLIHPETDNENEIIQTRCGHLNHIEMFGSLRLGVVRS